MLMVDYFWALSELIDSAKEVGAGLRASWGHSPLMVVDHDPGLVVVARAPGETEAM
jgi:hypothetical protein